MLNKKEGVIIIVTALILAFSISIMNLSWNTFSSALLIVFIILALNIAAKKVMGYYVESDVEIKLWEMQRYGFKAHQYFKKAIPIGAIIPILSSLITFGHFKWLAAMVFEVKPKVYRAAKRHGLYNFSEMTEYHIGLIAATGILINLLAAAIAYFLGFSEFARISIYFAFFNMIPISDLDGNKIFFGSLTLWAFLACLTLIAVGYAFLLI
jgi:Zn-dependent protease